MGEAVSSVGIALRPCLSTPASAVQTFLGMSYPLWIRAEALCSSLSP